MKLRKGVSPEELKKYGFRINYDHSAYEKKCDEYTIFMWMKHNDMFFVFHKFYLEKLDRDLILENFDILEKLIIDRIVE